jgi:hypothetical protein
MDEINFLAIVILIACVSVLILASLIFYITVQIAKFKRNRELRDEAYKKKRTLERAKYKYKSVC